MEIMANSDNVLRGGLTPKHIDVAELMKHVSFTATVPAIIRGTKTGEYEEVYISPAEDFQLSRLALPTDQTAIVHCNSTEIYFVIAGTVEMKERDQEPLKLKMGEAAVGFAGTSISIISREESVLFRATVPS